MRREKEGFERMEREMVRETEEEDCTLSNCIVDLHTDKLQNENRRERLQGI